MRRGRTLRTTHLAPLAPLASLAPPQLLPVNINHLKKLVGLSAPLEESYQKKGKGESRGPSVGSSGQKAVNFRDNKSKEQQHI